jgi:hypothetical protein
MGTIDNQVIDALNPGLGLRHGGPAGQRVELAVGCRVPVG